MRTLADLKRTLKVGQKIKTVRHDCISESVRTITKVQSNSFAMDGCWLYFPKKDCIEFINENTFNVYRAKQITFEGNIKFDDKQRGELMATYELLI